MYIYHNTEIDEYYSFNNLVRLSEETGINYDNLSLWFIRQKKVRIERDNWVIVKTELIKRKGSKQ